MPWARMLHVVGPDELQYKGQYHRARNMKLKTDACPGYDFTTLITLSINIGAIIIMMIAKCFGKKVNWSPIWKCKRAEGWNYYLLRNKKIISIMRIILIFRVLPLKCIAVCCTLLIPTASYWQVRYSPLAVKIVAQYHNNISVHKCVVSIRRSSMFVNEAEWVSVDRDSIPLKKNLHLLWWYMHFHSITSVPCQTSRSTFA